MSWSTPLTAVTSAVLTAAQWNASVRDNLNETAPAKATTAGGYFVATGSNVIAQRLVGDASVSTQEGTTSTSYTALSTDGPLVTVTTGTKALVIITGQMSNTTAATTSYASYEVSGATTVAASDLVSIALQSPANYDIRSSACTLQSLTSGSNTFRMLYRCGSGGGTSNFTRRRITVLPF